MWRSRDQVVFSRIQNAGCTFHIVCFCFRAKIKYNTEQIGPRTICDAINNLGFEATVLGPHNRGTSNYLEHKYVLIDFMFHHYYH